MKLIQLTGAKLYVNKYTEPGMQEAATPTYPVNKRSDAINRRKSKYCRMKQEMHYIQDIMIHKLHKELI